jgi:hypothetical protein
VDISRRRASFGDTPGPHDDTVALPAVGDELSPVFVDSSGRRGRKLRRIGWLLAGVCATYGAVLVVSLLGGEAGAPWLLIPDGAENKPSSVVIPPTAGASERPGARRPAPPYATAPRTAEARPESSDGASSAPSKSPAAKVPASAAPTGTSVAAAPSSSAPQPTGGPGPGPDSSVSPDPTGSSPGPDPGASQSPAAPGPGLQAGQA